MIMTQNMKGLVTTIALTAASTSTNGQNVNVIRSDNNPSTTTLELKEEDAKGGGDNYHQHPQKHLSSQGVSVRRILMDNTSPLLPEDETSIEKSESIGILSNNKESITHDQNVEVLSVPQEDVEDLQAQAQGRRLDTSAFLSRCETTSGRNGTDAMLIVLMVMLGVLHSSVLLHVMVTVVLEMVHVGIFKLGTCIMVSQAKVRVKSHHLFDWGGLFVLFRSF